MIATHQFKKGKHGDSCDYKRGMFFCGQPRNLHKQPKKSKIVNKEVEQDAHLSA